MSEQHAPAPWRIKPFGVGLDILDAEGADIAFVRPVRCLSEAFAHARLITAAPGLLQLANLPVVFEIEGDEGIIRLSLGGVELCAYPDGTAQAAALLRFEAARRAVIAEVGGGQ